METRHDVKCEEMACDRIFIDDKSLRKHIRKEHGVSGERSRVRSGDRGSEVVAVSPEARVAKVVTGRKVPREEFHLKDTGKRQGKEVAAKIKMAAKNESKNDMKGKNEAKVKKEVKVKKEMKVKHELKVKNEVNEVKNELKNDMKVKKEVKNEVKSPVGRRKSSDVTPLSVEQEYWLCSICQEEVHDSQAKLEEHERKDHKHTCNKGDETGGHCGRKFVEKATLLRHKAEAHGEVKWMWKCETCQELIENKSKLAHVKSVHNFPCGVAACGVASSNNKSRLKHHVLFHRLGTRMNPNVVEEVKEEAEDDTTEVEDEIEGAEMLEPVQVEGFFICRHCRIVLKPEKEAKHASLAHKITCSIRGCPRTFLKQSDQLHHLLAAHDDPDMVTSQGFFFCSRCNEVYEPKEKKQYENHLKFGLHFVCEKDGRQFSKATQAVAFEYHEKLEHSPCVTCDKASFVVLDVLVREAHMREGHGEGGEEGYDLVAGNMDEGIEVEDEIMLGGAEVPQPGCLLFSTVVGRPGSPRFEHLDKFAGRKEREGTRADGGGVAGEEKVGNRDHIKGSSKGKVSSKEKEPQEKDKSSKESSKAKNSSKEKELVKEKGSRKEQKSSKEMEQSKRKESSKEPGVEGRRLGKEQELSKVKELSKEREVEASNAKRLRKGHCKTEERDFVKEKSKGENSAKEKSKKENSAKEKSKEENSAKEKSKKENSAKEKSKEENSVEEKSKEEVRSGRKKEPREEKEQSKETKSLRERKPSKVSKPVGKDKLTKEMETFKIPKVLSKEEGKPLEHVLRQEPTAVVKVEEKCFEVFVASKVEPTEGLVTKDKVSNEVKLAGEEVKSFEVRDTNVKLAEEKVEDMLISKEESFGDSTILLEVKSEQVLEEEMCKESPTEVEVVVMSGSDVMKSEHTGWLILLATP